VHVVYANQTVTVWLKEDSQGALDPEKAIKVFAGDTFAEDHPLVIERPELFTTEDGSPISEEQE
jgi:hypothetical protein